MPRLPTQLGGQVVEGVRSNSSEGGSELPLFRPIKNVVASDPDGKGSRRRNEVAQQGAEEAIMREKVSSTASNSRSYFRLKCRNVRSDWKGKSSKLQSQCALAVVSDPRCRHFRSTIRERRRQSVVERENGSGDQRAKEIGAEEPGSRALSFILYLTR
ncbi:hypothetical protein MA16_Dca004131 [Dendrobium catenatum]|uniref:Uncharacterized protein n=1 Tax=Dendrobium catenatum TaxID=906689 RepID=A0A2I0X2G8_9ASPA|nr:hypothetical protein MA16_Dca004131 [Dendrobium catenatum]